MEETRSTDGMYVVVAGMLMWEGWKKMGKKHKVR